MRTIHPIEPLYITIGARIRAERVTRGIAQRDMAHALGYQSNGTLSLIESGKVRIPTHHLYLVAAFLGVSVDSLLT